MFRDEAIKLQAQARDFRRLGNSAYDDAKECDILDRTAKDYFFEKANNYWSKRDAINTIIRNAGFPDLMDLGDDDV